MKELHSNPQLLFFVCVFHFDSFLILVRQIFIDTYFIGVRKTNKENFIGCFVPKIRFMETKKDKLVGHIIRIFSVVG